MITTQITGETMIFKGDKGFYSTSIGRKLQDGTYKNAYINVGFKKDVNLENKTKINIKNGWLTFDNFTPKVDPTKEVIVWKIFINDFDVVGAENNIPSSNDFMDLSDDLPF